MLGRADTGGRLAALALAWLVGIVLQLQQPVLWPIEGYLAAIALSLLGASAARRWQRALVRKGKT